MERYTKVISLRGYYFVKEYEKKKKNKVKRREIKDFTIEKFFKEGKCEVLVYFEEKDMEILITPDSPKEDIEKYLGKSYLE